MANNGSCHTLAFLVHYDKISLHKTLIYSQEPRVLILFCMYNFFFFFTPKVTVAIDLH